MAMYRQILVPTDGSALSEKAVTHAIGLAKALGAGVTAFYMSSEYPIPMYAEGVVIEPISMEEYKAMAETEARKILDDVKAKAQAAGVACTTRHVIASSPWESILEAAGEVGADVIVMASHGRRGMSALLLGSETSRVLTHSTLPVVVVR
jgi:nucleotide-binding universal stress UspA family protein